MTHWRQYLTPEEAAEVHKLQGVMSKGMTAAMNLRKLRNRASCRLIRMKAKSEDVRQTKSL